MPSLPFFVGCYTQAVAHAPNACGEGVYSCNLDLETGVIEQVHTSEKGMNPAYLSHDERAGILYVSQAFQKKEGKVVSYEIKKSQKLKRIDKVQASGKAVCHVLHHKGRVFATSYADGLLDVFESKKGKLSLEKSFSYKGKGPNKARQEKAHAHQSILSPDKKYLYVCDLGSDKIWSHRLKKPLEKAKNALSLPPGSGPRHMVFHPAEPIAYILSELTAILSVAKYRKSSGGLSIKNEINTLPPDFKGMPSSAAIRIHPRARALYVSNRQHNSFTAYAIDKEGKLSFMARLPSGGKEPRDIQVDPSGSFLLCANQNSNNISVYKLDKKGRPIPGIVHVFECKTPVCIEF
ncbi:MAG: lactonase family protein [Bacteroidia bacterium]|nr:lactonase family protein [Bacteroidia bacterium]